MLDIYMMYIKHDDIYLSYIYKKYILHINNKYYIYRRIYISLLLSPLLALCPTRAVSQAPTFSPELGSSLDPICF